MTNFKSTEDNVLKVVLGTGDSYCIAGSASGTDTDYWYDSVTGATEETATGTCSAVPAAL